MAEIGPITFAGQSGRQYGFQMYTLGTPFKALGAVYVMLYRYQKPDGWYATPIYFGETGDLSTRFNGHHRQACFDRNGVNCVGIHLDGDEQSRRTKETDLIRKWDPECNRQ